MEVVKILMFLATFLSLLSSPTWGQYFQRDDDELPEHKMKVDTITGDEKLVVIKALSSSRRTFVIQKGAKDGISRNQKALFSTERVSLMCKAVEVSHDFSLWKVVDDMAIVPFSKREFVVFNTSLETIWMKIPHLKDQLKKKIVEVRRVTEPYWVFRWNISRMLYESVTETASGSSDSRSGFQYELLYNIELTGDLDLGFGGRFDQETASIDESSNEPSINIPSTRYFGIAEIKYKFKYFQKSKGYWYAAIGTGFGASSTTTDNTVSTGTAAILPSFRIGLKSDINRTKSFLLEGVAESIAVIEEFKNGQEQRTNIVNAKFAIGFMF